MKLNPLVIGEVKARIPIIQGGMGVGISGHRLSSAVANEGGIGIISGVQIGYNEPDFETNTLEANKRGLKKEIRKARELSPNGILGVNLMVAINNYEEMVDVCVEEKVDVIISGAGLPMQLPKFVAGSSVKIAPIVSSGKAAYLITKQWIKKNDRIPDFIVVEGPEAGGHLGFHREQLDEDLKLEDIVLDVIEAIKPFEDEFKIKIPVIAAGGIFTGEDIAKFIKLGAAGVQIGTRFIATEECDAHINYKNAFIKCSEEEIKVIQSPVGLPGRAIRNDFIKETEKGKIKPEKCYRCIKKCNPSETPYCISKALINAVKGNVEEGLIFSGSNGYRIKEIVTVKQLMNELITSTEKHL